MYTVHINCDNTTVQNSRQLVTWVLVELRKPGLRGPRICNRMSGREVSASRVSYTCTLNCEPTGNGSFYLQSLGGLEIVYWTAVWLSGPQYCTSNHGVVHVVGKTANRGNFVNYPTKDDNWQEYKRRYPKREAMMEGSELEVKLSR